MPTPARFVRGIAAGLVATTGLWVAAAQTPSAPPDQVFRGAVDFVRVDAYPRRDGRVVEGLTAADFTVLEDGRPQAIDTFEFVRHAPDPAFDRLDPRNRAEAERWLADPTRRVFIVYLDLYHISRSSSHQIRGPLIEMLARAIGPSDVVAVMTPETPIGDLAFTQTLNTVSAELERYWAWGLLDAPVQPRTPAERQLAACGDARNGYDGIIRAFRDDVLFTSIESLVAHIGALRQDRTNVMLLSEGWQNRRGGIDMRNLGNLPGRSRVTPGMQIAPGAPAAGQFGRTPDLTAGHVASCTELLARLQIDFDDRFRRLFRIANANNVSFHTIDVGGLRTNVVAAEARSPVGAAASAGSAATLRELAENTDGVATIGANDIAYGLRRVVEHTAAYYLIGYASTNTTADGRYRRIEVRVNQRGIDVTARRGYTAASPRAQALADAGSAGETVPAPVAAALGALSRWDAGEGLFAAGIGTAAGLTVVAELAPREIRSGRWRAGGDLVVELIDEAGDPRVASASLTPGSSSVLVDIPVDDGQRGPWRAYVRATNGTGEVTTRIDVPARAASGLGPARFFRIPAIGRPVPRPIVAPIYRRGERLRVLWQPASPSATPTIRLVDRRGQTLEPGAALTETFDAARGTLTVDLYVAALAAGDYAIEVIAGDKADPQFAAFRVER